MARSPADGEEFWIEGTLKRAVIGGAPCVVSLVNDITDRRRAEQELLESRRKLSSAVSIAKLGYWEYDVASDTFTFDDHFYAIFHTTAEKVGGYTMSSARYAKLFLLPDEMHRVAEEIELSRSSDDPNFNRYLEHRIVYADGGVGQMAVHHFAVKDEHGRTIKTYGANQDITDRKRAEEALRASEQNYREIFNGTMNAVFVHEIPSGRIVDVNQTVLDMFGCSRDEAIQMSFWRKVSVGSPYTPAAAIRLIRRATTEGQQVVQWPVRRRNGEEFWVEVVVKQAFIGGVPRVLVLMNDISDRRRSEEALKSSEQNYRELFNATMNAIFVHEIPSGRIVDVNQTMLDMFGVSYEEALALSVEDISLGTSPYSQREAVELINKAAAEGPQQFEWHSRRKNGQSFWAEVILKRATVGGVPRVLALVNDVTDEGGSPESVGGARKIDGAEVNVARRADPGIWADCPPGSLPMTINETSVDQSAGQGRLRQLLESQERERRLIAYEIHDGLAQHLAAAAMYCSTFEQLRESSPEDAAKSHEAGAIMLQKALAKARRLIGGLRPAVLDESGLVAAVASMIEELECARGSRSSSFPMCDSSVLTRFGRTRCSASFRRALPTRPVTVARRRSASNWRRRRTG